MTFTQADHDKAVELYRKYRDSDWWPKVAYHSDIDRWKTAFELSGSDQFGIAAVHALSAIAWAMVERLVSKGGCGLAPREPHKESPACYAYDEHGQISKHYAPTHFLALAAAVEALDKGG